MEFLLSLRGLCYIEGVDSSLTEGKRKACIELNKNFSRNYKIDMERTKRRLKFMEKFGGPLDSLNLTKSIVLWYPSYFIVQRLIFVASCLLLWDRPLTMLSIRIVEALFSFCLIRALKPFEEKRSTRLELMNYATIICMVDVIVNFTEVLNAGNSEDLDPETYELNQ